MALINCPECSKQISDKAVSCPNCGYPLNATSFQETQNVSEYNGISTLDYLVLDVVERNHGKKVQSIKELCDLTGMKMGEAKKLVDDYCKNKNK